MNLRRTSLCFALEFTSLALFACGSDNKACDPNNPVATCRDGSVCELIAAAPTCVPPVVIRGIVKSLAGSPIAGARVSAVDANGAPTSGAVDTDLAGAYELRVAAPRISATAIESRKVKLQAAAAGFEPFPAGLRPSLPIELSTATKAGTKLVVQTTATDIVLFPLASTSGLGSIGGTVRGFGPYGVLVAAEGSTGPAQTATASSDGSYVLFNVPAGAWNVTAYTSGVRYPTAPASVTAGARTTINLASVGAATATISGNVNMVNPGDGTVTSVVLVLESTFNTTLKRGVVPPGLRAPRTGAPNVTNAFSITEVPPGRYVVLAAFENDNLVRDPDTSIGGTQIQHITVAEGQTSVPLAASFKITGALNVMSPGGGDEPGVTNATPSFVWKDDSSEDKYTLEVFDSYGTRVWNVDDVPRVTGSASVTVQYSGPALMPGRYYQFRATSIKDNVPISQTEDLRGIFVVQ